MTTVTRNQVIEYNNTINMALVNLNDIEVWVPYHELFVVRPLDIIVEECRKLVKSELVFVGTDEDEEGTYYMYQASRMWFNFRERDGKGILDDYGVCSDWSSVE